MRLLHVASTLPLPMGQADSASGGEAHPPSLVLQVGDGGSDWDLITDAHVLLPRGVELAKDAAVGGITVEQQPLPTTQGRARCCAEDDRRRGAQLLGHVPKVHQAPDFDAEPGVVEGAVE
jgi:hypothetical protein